MKVPKLLWIPILVIVIGGVIGLVLRLSSGCNILGDIASFALILTLATLVFYTYYTYLLAMDAQATSASFMLEPFQGDPYHIAFRIRNFSKISLNCWCKLNATVEGVPVSLGGFYNGESSFDLQPFGIGSGHFDIRKILQKANRSLKEMKDAALFKDNPKEQLYLDIEFWYNPVGKDKKVHNPRQPHYFNFLIDVFVADF